MKVLIVSDASLDDTTRSHLATEFEDTYFAVTDATSTAISANTIPLTSGALAFPQNAWRVAQWTSIHSPTVYLSFGGDAASLAHLARRATGGNGMSVVCLSSLYSPKSWRFGAWLERRAILHCDRILVPSGDLAQQLVTHYHARGGDIHVVPFSDPHAIADSIRSFLQEPPGWMG